MILHHCLFSIILLQLQEQESYKPGGSLLAV